MHPIDKLILEGLTYDGQFLSYKGKPLKRRQGKRFVHYYNNTCYDAAALVFLMTFRVWPYKRLKFLDDDYYNLSIANLKLADCRKDKAKMCQQHIENMDRLNGIPELAETVPENCELVKHKGAWLIIPKAKGVWDDRKLRIEAVVKQRREAQAMQEKPSAIFDTREAAFKSTTLK